MRLMPTQKEKLKNSEHYIELPTVESHIGKCFILINSSRKPEPQFKHLPLKGEGSNYIWDRGERTVQVQNPYKVC